MIDRAAVIRQALMQSRKVKPKPKLSPDLRASGGHGTGKRNMLSPPNFNYDYRDRNGKSSPAPLF